MLINSQIPFAEVSEENFKILTDYSREYAAEGYPGMDEQLKEIAGMVQRRDDILLLSSSVGRPQYRGAYLYLQFAVKSSGLATLHHLYTNLMGELSALREAVLWSTASINGAPTEFFKQITSISLCYSIKNFPQRIKKPGYYTAITLRAPVESVSQQEILIRALTDKAKELFLK